MTNKVTFQFRVTPDGLTPVGPDAWPRVPTPRQVFYAESAPPQMQERMKALEALPKPPVETGWLTVTIEEPDEHNPVYQRMLASAPAMIEKMKQEDPAMYERFIQGGGFQPSRTLAQIREQLGGDEGEWYVPSISYKAPISLKAWADADPQTTRLVISTSLIHTRDDLKDLPGFAEAGL